MASAAHSILSRVRSEWETQDEGPLRHPNVVLHRKAPGGVLLEVSPVMAPVEADDTDMPSLDLGAESKEASLEERLMMDALENQRRRAAVFSGNYALEINTDGEGGYSAGIIAWPARRADGSAADPEFDPDTEFHVLFPHISLAVQVCDKADYWTPSCDEQRKRNAEHAALERGPRVIDPLLADPEDGRRCLVLLAEKVEGLHVAGIPPEGGKGYVSYTHDGSFRMHHTLFGILDFHAFDEDEFRENEADYTEAIGEALAGIRGPLTLRFDGTEVMKKPTGLIAVGDTPRDYMPIRERIRAEIARRDLPLVERHAMELFHVSLTRYTGEAPEDPKDVRVDGTVHIWRLSLCVTGWACTNRKCRRVATFDLAP